MAAQRKPGSARTKATPQTGSSTSKRKGRGSSARAAQGRSTGAGKSASTKSRGRPKNKREAETRLVAADRQLAKELPRRDIDLIVKDSEHTVALIQTKEPQKSSVTGEMLPSAHE